MTAKEIEKSIEFVRFNMTCEGFELTDEDIAIGREILNKNITGDKAVEYVISKNGYIQA